MGRGHLIAVLVATAYVTIAFINVLLPPADLLERLRAGVYTAYFDWGVVSADGSHAYAEARGYKAAVNLWKIVICDPAGRCTSQQINALALYIQLKAAGALIIEDRGGGCYYVELKPVEIAQRKLAAKADLCLDRSGAPTKINAELQIDGEVVKIGGAPARVERTFLFDRYYAIHGE